MSEHSIAQAAKAPAVLSQVPTGLLQRQCACGQHTMGGECEGCRKNSTLQRKSAGGRVANVPPIVSDVLRSPGQPLDPGTRAFFEPRFGHDFSRVRVHTGPRAAASAAAVDATAYTVGTNIVFGEGKFGSTRPDHGLLGHELAHVLQQSGSVSGYTDLAVSHDMTAERQADRAAAQVSAGHRVGPLSAAPIPIVQREEAPKAAPAELNWFEKALIETAAAPALTFGETVHAMVKATFRGFLVEVKTQAPARGEELWNHVKEAFAHPIELGKFLLRYYWGLIKGIFSPITGLFDLAVLAAKLTALPGQILETAWTRRSELAAEAGNIGSSLGQLSARARDAIKAFKQSPLQTVKALEPWFSSLQDNAIATAESGGHQAGAALMAQAGKPLPELGETAGEIIGTVLINIVLLVFTEGIGNAITQVASKLGEFASFLGKFGKAAQMLGKIAAEVGELLGTIGGWISKAEAALAKVAETVLKPIAPLMEELGKLMSGLRSFLRKLLGVSEEAAVGAGEQLAGTTAKAVEGHLPSQPVSKALPKPAVSIADQSSELAGAKALAKPSSPPVVKAKPVAPVTQEGGELVGAKVTPKSSAPPAVTPKAPLASRAKVFEGISEETEQLLARRPGLARALEQHPEAADLFKLCKSHCFPDFMTDEEIAERLIRLEHMQRAAAEAGVPFERGPTKQLLHRQKTIDEVDKALSSLEDALRARIRKLHLPGETEEPLSALTRPQTERPPRPKGKAVKGATTQFEGRPEKMPEGFEDLPEQTGAGERGTAGGRGEKPKTAAGKFAHEHAELLQKNPEILRDLQRRTGQSKVFDTELPEGLQPEYAVIHRDYPPGMRPRIDRLWRKGDTIFEIKPNTFAAEKGEAQVQQYAEWMDRFEPLPRGQKWKWKLVQYDQSLLKTYLEEMGWLAKPVAATP
jgi:hypothetical protein